MKISENAIQKKIKEESGQSFAEFALIIPILVLLLMIPIEYYRIISTKIILNSAASDALVQLEDKIITRDNLYSEISNNISKSYADSINVNKLIKIVNLDNEIENDYKYYVYSSDKENSDFSKQFDIRDSNFKSQSVSLKLKYNVKPITLLGMTFLGDEFEVETREYKRDIYLEGYTEDIPLADEDGAGSGNK